MLWKREREKGGEGGANSSTHVSGNLLELVADADVI